MIIPIRKEDEKEIIISFESVLKKYDDNQNAALNYISFFISKGEFVFIAGHSGAGKSTLLHLIAGIEFPTAGRVQVNGVFTSDLDKGQIPYLRRSIGLVFQDHRILYDRSVAQNVMLPLQIKGMSNNEAQKRVFHALRQVDLLNKMDCDPRRLSGGEQQRICIARAIVHNPEIILADEPTGNLDKQNAKDIMELFKNFNKEGITVVVSAHDEELMSNFCTKIIRLSRGYLSECIA